MTPGRQSKGNTNYPRLRSRKAAPFPLLMALALVTAVATGCGEGAGQCPTSQLGNPANKEESAITVFAAASLTDAFNAIAREYRLQNPGIELVLNFDGSQRLRTQLEHGAQADVFASADWDQMEAVESRGLTASPPINFASNRLIILGYIGSGGNLDPKTFSSDSLSEDTLRRNLEPLATPGMKIVVGQPQVPIGRYTEQFLEAIETSPALGQELAGGMRANVVSREGNVRAIVQKVDLGEVDAGVVYSSDATQVSAGVTVLELPESINVNAHYPIAALTRKPGVSEFVGLVMSERGQQILRDYDFGPPLDNEENNRQ